eukprot:Nk52_evm1s1530 gene=Nk52_evmTU1s1530
MIILGCPWLDQYKVNLQYGSHRKIQIGKYSCAPDPTPTDVDSELPISMISAKACNRISKKKDCEVYYFRISVKSGPENDKNDEKLSKFDEYLTNLDPSKEKLKNLLSEYRDVFPDELPDRLPPERPLDHQIRLKPNSTPPAKKQY